MIKFVVKNIAINSYLTLPEYRQRENINRVFGSSTQTVSN